MAPEATANNFEGWVGLDPDSVHGNMKWQSFEPKPFEETDVELKITHTGVCGSDIHTLRSGWRPSMYPVCVGHEIVGTAVKVGSEAKFKVGDRLGVGAQCGSCLRADCYECSHDNECYCQKAFVGTYNSTFPDGSKSYGGYGNFWRGPSHFTFKIPDALSSEQAAPMLCGGITTYSPLVRNGAGPGKRVGIVGIGGLGHYGLLWAKALGADKVVAVSRTAAKKADALKMGADEYIAADDEGADWAKRHAGTLDIIVCTVSGPNMPIASYLQLLRVGGVLVLVGAPEDPIPQFGAFSLIPKGTHISGSSIGSPKEIREMLDLAASKKVRGWVEARPLQEANKAVVDFTKNMPRYRYVLVNEKHAS